MSKPNLTTAEFKALANKVKVENRKQQWNDIEPELQHVYEHSDPAARSFANIVDEAGGPPAPGDSWQPLIDGMNNALNININDENVIGACVYWVGGNAVCANTTADQCQALHGVFDPTHSC